MENKNIMVLSAKNINKSFKIKGENANHILKNISVEIEKGKITSFMGASGVGKSTLLYILGAIDSPDSGDIILNSNNAKFHYSQLKSAELAVLRNKHIGFVFQFHHLLPEFTILENIIMPALIAGTSQKEAEHKAIELMEKIGIVDIKKHKPNEISGGEQQRAAIIRAIINSPEIVLADEPTGNLDSKNAANVMDLIQRLNAGHNITFLIATHSQEVAKKSHKIIKMQDGKIMDI